MGVVDGVGVIVVGGVGVVRKRKVRHQVLRDRIDAVGGQDVAGKGRVGDRIAQDDGGAGGAQGTGKIAGALERGGHFGEAIAARVLAQGFPTGEEEGAIFAPVNVRHNHGSAERCPVLIAEKSRLLGVEEVARGQRIGAGEFESAAVRDIGAAAQHHVHDAAGQASVLGGAAGGLDAELLHRIVVGHGLGDRRCGDRNR